MNKLRLSSDINYLKESVTSPKSESAADDYQTIVSPQVRSPFKILKLTLLMAQWVEMKAENITH